MECHTFFFSSIYVSVHVILGAICFIGAFYTVHTMQCDAISEAHGLKHPQQYDESNTTMEKNEVFRFTFTNA